MKITESANDELSVKPFDNQHKRSSILHPDLLHPPFSLLLVGPKGSGKGNCTLRLIFGNQKKKGCQTNHHKFYRHYFDKIYVFSPTWQLDPKMRRCQIPTDQIFEEPEMYTEVISEILEGQVEDIEEEGKEEADDILMIFSDLAGHKTFADSKGIMNRLAFNHRHYNVSIIIDTQSLRQINNAFRNNLSGIILFAGINPAVRVAAYGRISFPETIVAVHNGISSCNTPYANLLVPPSWQSAEEVHRSHQTSGALPLADIARKLDHILCIYI